MLKDIKQLTELYLYAEGLLPEDKSWNDFHEELIRNAPKDATKLLSDANPKGKCKYALFIDVDTKHNNCVITNKFISKASLWYNMRHEGNGRKKVKA